MIYHKIVSEIEMTYNLSSWDVKTLLIPYHKNCSTVALWLQTCTSSGCVRRVQLMGGVTAIDVSLCGFSDTNQHGWHVHAVGSTDNQCLAAGPHFNPNNLTHGAPDDVKRFVHSMHLQFVETGRWSCLCPNCPHPTDYHAVVSLKQI